jgi:NaMN:DMB phosphoribosyltransferase
MASTTAADAGRSASNVGLTGHEELPERINKVPVKSVAKKPIRPNESDVTTPAVEAPAVRLDATAFVAVNREDPAYVE